MLNLRAAVHIVIPHEAGKNREACGVAPMKLMNASEFGSTGAALMSSFHQFDEGRSSRYPRGSSSITTDEGPGVGVGLGDGDGEGDGLGDGDGPGDGDGLGDGLGDGEGGDGDEPDVPIETVACAESTEPFTFVTRTKNTTAAVCVEAVRNEVAVAPSIECAMPFDHSYH
jgi:hypothetical protein